MQAIIMDHYRYPHNKRTVEDESYSKIHMDSDSCVDDIYVYLKVEGNIVKDVAFDGIACTIATSSTSIMTDLVIGKTIEESREIIKKAFHFTRVNCEHNLVLSVYRLISKPYFRPKSGL